MIGKHDCNLRRFDCCKMGILDFTLRTPLYFLLYILTSLIRLTDLVSDFIIQMQLIITDAHSSVKDSIYMLSFPLSLPKRTLQTSILILPRFLLNQGFSTVVPRIPRIPPEVARGSRKIVIEKINIADTIIFMQCFLRPKNYFMLPPG